MGSSQERATNGEVKQRVKHWLEERRMQREYEKGVREVDGNIEKYILLLSSNPQFTHSNPSDPVVKRDTGSPDKQQWPSEPVYEFLGRTEQRIPGEKLVIMAHKTEEGYVMEFFVVHPVDVPETRDIDRWITISTTRRDVDVKCALTSLPESMPNSIADAAHSIADLHQNDIAHKRTMADVAKGLVDFGSRVTIESIQAQYLPSEAPL